MPQQPSVALDTIQIRYRLPYLTFLRMKSFKQGYPLSMSQACNMLLECGLDQYGITKDPAVLLGLSEGSPKGGGEAR